MEKKNAEAGAAFMACSGGKEYTAVGVTTGGTVEWDSAGEVQEGDWSILVSADGLKAILKVVPKTVIHRELVDLPGMNNLQPKVMEREERFPPLTWDELLQELSRLGIKNGIDWEACLRAVTYHSEEEVVIACGTPAEPGEDGAVELLFTTEPVVATSVDDEEQVDYRERYVFTSVESGEILAVKRAPEIGRPGVSVKGEIIIPPQPRDIRLQAGEGALLSDDGIQVFASRAGRPIVYRGHNLFRVGVLPELIHNGDVNLVSGNIEFKGDIKISGNVETGMQVKAGGNVIIDGYVSQAVIQAAGSIWIKGNIMSSHISAGTAGYISKETLIKIRVLSSDLQELSAALCQVMADERLKRGNYENRLSQVLRLLMGGRFKTLPAAADAFIKQVKTLPGSAGAGLDGFIRDLESLKLRSPLIIQDVREIESLARQAAEWEQFFSCPPGTESDVRAKGALNSTLVTSGNVMIADGGCYNTQIKAGKKVVISGVFRGGEIITGGDVSVDEFGSKAGVISKVITGITAKVKIKKAFENASIVMGGKVYNIAGEQSNIRLRLDQEGSLISGY